MVQFYVMRIKLGAMVLEQVPERWRAAVAAVLREVTGNGTGP